MDEQAGLQEHQRTASVPPPKFTTTTTSTPPHPPTAELGVDLGHRLVDGGGGEGAESWSAGAKKKKTRAVFRVFLCGGDGVQRDSGLLLKFSLHNLAGKQKV